MDSKNILRLVNRLELEAVWPRAMELRRKNRLGKHLSVYELASLTWENFHACVEKRPEDFVGYFNKALDYRLRRELGRTRRAARRRDQMKGYEKDKEKAFLSELRNRFVEDALLEFVGKLVKTLPPDDHWLLNSLYWAGSTLRRLSRQTGLSFGHLQREHARILTALRGRIEKEFWGWRRPTRGNGKRAA